MNSIDHISSMRKASLRKAISSCERLYDALGILRRDGLFNEYLVDVRSDIEELNQRCHELNAYNNAFNALIED